MYKNQTSLNQFVHLASLLVRVEEVARERYGQHSGCGTRDYLETTLEPLAALLLGSNCRGKWRTKCRIHARVSARPSRSPWPWFVGCASARVRQSRGEILADAQRRLVILGPMAVNPFQGLRWLLHDHADRHQVHGSKMRPNYFTTAGE